MSFNFSVRCYYLFLLIIYIYHRFAVLGMGDSSYEHFNYVAKKLFRRLTQLGGQPMCDIGLADDQHDLGPFAVIDPWINNLWNVLIVKHPLTGGLEPMDRNSLPPPK